jgi:hypothetical protein
MYEDLNEIVPSGFESTTSRFKIAVEIGAIGLAAGVGAVVADLQHTLLAERTLSVISVTGGIAFAVIGFFSEEFRSLVENHHL